MAYYRGTIKHCTFTTELRIITSILPRQAEERSEKQREASGVA
jgi:hypothetical protein